MSLNSIVDSGKWIYLKDQGDLWEHRNLQFFDGKILIPYFICSFSRALVVQPTGGEFFVLCELEAKDIHDPIFQYDKN